MRPVHSLLIAVALACMACGGKAHPRKPDPKALAAALDADLRQLNAIATQHEAKCEPLIATLGPHVDKMRAHADEVKTAMNDREFAKRLKAEVSVYTEHATLSDATAESLARSYLACDKDKRLVELIDKIPVM